MLKRGKRTKPLSYWSQFVKRISFQWKTFYMLRYVFEYMYMFVCAVLMQHSISLYQLRKLYIHLWKTRQLTGWLNGWRVVCLLLLQKFRCKCFYAFSIHFELNHMSAIQPFIWSLALSGSIYLYEGNIKHKFTIASEAVVTTVITVATSVFCVHAFVSYWNI